MNPENSPAATTGQRPLWLFPLGLLLVAAAAIIVLTLTRTPLPHELSFPTRIDMPPPPLGDELLDHLALASAYGLYALPVLGMAGLLAGGGFDWGSFGVSVFADMTLFAFVMRANDPCSGFFWASALVILACALLFGSLGGLLAGRRGWGVNRTALLNLPLGVALAFVVTRFWNPGFFLPKTDWAHFSSLGVVAGVAAMSLIAWLLLRRSALGRRLRALGADASAARLAGVARGWAMFAAFALCAVGMALFAFQAERLRFSPLPAVGALWPELPSILRIGVDILFFNLLFLAIAACGGGLAGRGRVSIAGLLCAALAVPMLDYALVWAPWATAHYLRGYELSLLTIAGILVQRRRG